MLLWSTSTLITQLKETIQITILKTIFFIFSIVFANLEEKKYIFIFNQVAVDIRVSQKLKNRNKINLDWACERMQTRLTHNNPAKQKHIFGHRPREVYDLGVHIIFPGVGGNILGFREGGPQNIAIQTRLLEGCQILLKTPKMANSKIQGYPPTLWKLIPRNETKIQLDRFETCFNDCARTACAKTIRPYCIGPAPFGLNI